MKLSYVTLTRSQSWKRLVVILLLSVIFGSLLVYFVVQKRYAGVLEKERYEYWKEMKKLQQELLPLWKNCDPATAACSTQQRQTIMKMTAWFEWSPQLFRLLLVTPDGTVIVGKERPELTREIQINFSSSSHKVTRYGQNQRLQSEFADSVHILQLALDEAQPRGNLRAEYFIKSSHSRYLRIAQATLHITLITSAIMMLFGIFLIVSRMIRRNTEKQQQIEEYALCLEQANYNLRRTKKELYISEKLASLGYLAAGIAHEIGNPLGAVLGYVELLQRSQLDQAKMQDVLQRIERDVERIRQIIQELVTFSRPNSLHLENINVNLLLQKMLANFPVPQTKQITIRLRLTDFPLFTCVDPHKLRSVFLNILSNAIDAIAREGDIEISTSRRIRETSTMLEGSEVIAIQFSDTGAGIPEELLPRIFDPFFTTKDPGSGMGLGLSLTHRIIESFHGEIEVQSVAGQGTDVTIFLPPSRKKSD